MSYIGNQAQAQGSFDKVDDISTQFNGVLVTFDLLVGAVAREVAKATNLIVALDGILQEPDVDYTVSGSQITFTVAPTSSAVDSSITVLGDVFKAPIGAIGEINEISDVVLTTPAENDIIRYSGGSWVNSPLGTATISSNTDVDTITTPPTTGQVLSWSGSVWVPADDGGGGSIDELTDVDTSTVAPTTSQTLSWNGTNWVPADASSVGSIDDLSDVDTTTSAPTTDQVLSWNGTNWVPADGGGGGGASLVSPLEIYVSSTGNDTTGDGTSGTPYLTLGKAMEVINATPTNNEITIFIPSGNTLAMPDPITIDLSQRLTIRNTGIGTGVEIDCTGLSASTMFYLEGNSSLYLYGIEFINSENYSLCDPSTNDTKIELNLVDGLVYRLMHTSDMRIDMRLSYCILDLKDDTIFSNSNLFFDNVSFWCDGVVDSSIVMITFNDCDVEFIACEFHNTGTTNPYMEFYGCRSKRLDIAFDGTSSTKSSLMKFNECNFNAVAVYSNISVSYPIYIEYSTVNNLYISYTSGSTWSENAGTNYPAINAIQSSVDGLYMSHGGVAVDFGSTDPIIYARTGSRIVCNTINGCGATLITDPVAISPSGTYTFSNGATTTGSCVFVGEVT